MNLHKEASNKSCQFIEFLHLLQQFFSKHQAQLNFL